MQMLIKLCHHFGSDAVRYSITVSILLTQSLNLFPSKVILISTMKPQTRSQHRTILTLVRFCARFQLDKLLPFPSCCQFKYADSFAITQQINKLNHFNCTAIYQISAAAFFFFSSLFLSLQSGFLFRNWIHRQWIEWMKLTPQYDSSATIGCLFTNAFELSIVS